MPKKYKVSKSYPQSSFRRILKTKTELGIANDNTDMLIYLIYMDYLGKLMSTASEDGISERKIEENHEQLLKYYRG